MLPNTGVITVRSQQSALLEQAVLLSEQSFVIDQEFASNAMAPAACLLCPWSLAFQCYVYTLLQLMLQGSWQVISMCELCSLQ